MLEGNYNSYEYPENSGAHYCPLFQFCRSSSLTVPNQMTPTAAIARFGQWCWAAHRPKRFNQDIRSLHYSLFHCNEAAPRLHYFGRLMNKI